MMHLTGHVASTVEVFAADLPGVDPLFHEICVCVVPHVPGKSVFDAHDL